MSHALILNNFEILCNAQLIAYNYLGNFAANRL